MAYKYEKGIIMLVVDERGKIIAAQENGKAFAYEKGQTRKIDEGTFSVKSQNPCCWRKRNGRWVCIPC